MSRRYRPSSSSDSHETKGHQFEWYGNNRHLCDVLDDMRKCLESLNFSPLKGLIEEAQVMGNRMEAGLRDKKDLVKINVDMSVARKAYKELEREYKRLDKKVESLRPPKPKENKS